MLLSGAAVSARSGARERSVSSSGSRAPFHGEIYVSNRKHRVDRWRASAVRFGISLAISLGCLATAACDEAQEAPRLTVPVVVDSRGVAPVTTDLGYRVEVSVARVALRDIEFTVAGEVHKTSMLERVLSGWARTAIAHPGHFQGGEVTGTLSGRFVVDWLGAADAVIGEATLIEGQYTAANFAFDRGSIEAGLQVDDPLMEHTAHVEGIAERDGEAYPFVIILDTADGLPVIGVPFVANMRSGSNRNLGFRFEPLDRFEFDTVFDGIDFALLENDVDGIIYLMPRAERNEEAYFQFRRTFQTHDHFAFESIP